MTPEVKPFQSLFAKQYLLPEMTLKLKYISDVTRKLSKDETLPMRSDVWVADETSLFSALKMIIPEKLEETRRLFWMTG